MAYTYNDFLNAASSSGMLQKISSSDLELAKQYPEFGLSMLSLTKDLDSATTAEQKVLATEAADQLRSTYGSKRSVGSSFRYGNETAYQKALNAVTNPDAFSYDVENDEVMAAYRKQYLREGERAVADTLAKVSAATGGRPSSYAVTAAQQAGDYYNSKLTDMVPTLYQNAYQRYLNDLDIKQAGLAALQSDRETAYNRYLNQLQMEQEAEQQVKAERLAKAQLLADAGDYSLLAQYYGLTNEQLAALYQDEPGGSVEAEEDPKQYGSNLMALNDRMNAMTDGGKMQSAVNGLSGNLPAATSANVNNGFTGKSYAEAVQYMRTYGLDTDVIAGLISKDDWYRAKSNGSTATEVNAYTSYEDYIRAYVEYALFVQKYPGKVRQPTTTIGPYLMAQ